MSPEFVTEPKTVSMLFGRRMPELPARPTTEQLFAAYGNAAPDDGQAGAAIAAVLRQLQDTHGFDLTADDLKRIRSVHRSFVSAGPAAAPLTR